MRKSFFFSAIGLALLASGSALAGTAVWGGPGGDYWNTNSSPYALSTTNPGNMLWSAEIRLTDGWVQGTSGVVLVDSSPSATSYIFGWAGPEGNRPYRRLRSDGTRPAWSAPWSAQGGTGENTSASPDGKYIYVTHVASPHQVRAWNTESDPAGGSPLWNVSVAGIVYETKVGPDGRIYGHPADAGYAAGTTALDPNSGSVVWQSPGNLEDPAAPGAFYDTGTLWQYVVSGRSTWIGAYDISAPSGSPAALLWSYQDRDALGFTHTGWSSPTIDPATGTIYVFRETRAIALDADGTLLWSSPVVEAGEGNRSCGALSRDGSTYYVKMDRWNGVTETGKFYAYDTADGNIKWSYPLMTRDWWPQDGGPVVSSNDVIFVAAGKSWGRGNYLYAMLDTGSSANVLWSFELKWGDVFYANPGFAIGPGTVYVDGMDVDGNDRLWAFRGTDLPLMIESTSLANGKVQAPYSFTVRALSGTPPYTWSATGLPTGLTIHPSSGLISGTSSAGGAHTVTITVTDSAGSPAADTRAFGLSLTGSEILPWVPSPTGRVGVAFSKTITTDVNLPPYTWSLAGGSLPPGLTLGSSSTNVVAVSGTPTTPGTYNFVVQSVDGVSWTDTESFTIEILAMDLIGGSAPPNATNPNSLCNIVGNTNPGAIGEWYSFAPTVLGGFSPFTFSLTGSLPPGLSLNTATGEISGTPTTLGTYAFTLSVVDSGTPQNSDTAGFAIPIGGRLALDIITRSVRNGWPGHPYGPQVFEKIGGDGTPVTWTTPTISGNGLPPGVSAAQVGSTLVLSGTPYTLGDYTFSVQVADSTRVKALTYKIVITEPGDWIRLADNPSLWPYKTGVKRGDSTYTIDPPESFTGFPMPDNRKWVREYDGAAAGNGKLYTVGGWGGSSVSGTRSWPGGSEVRWWADNRQSHLGVYDLATDVWANSNWKPWTVLAMRPGNAFPGDGSPTGYNDPHDAKRPWSPSSPLEAPWRCAVADEGTSMGSSDQFCYDGDSDGTAELYTMGGYPIWAPHGMAYWDPDDNGWRDTADQLVDSHEYGITAVDSETARAYVLSGYAWPYLRVMRYDFATDSWSQMPNAPLHFNDIGTGEVINHRLLCVYEANPVIRFDTTTETWLANGASPPADLGYFTMSFAWNGKMVVPGGRVEGVNQNAIRIYDPASDAWTTSSLTVQPEISGGGCDVVGDWMYLYEGLRPGGWWAEDTHHLYKAHVNLLDPLTITDAKWGSVTITWTSTPGKTYDIVAADAAQYSDTMTWYTLAGGIPSGGASTSYTDVTYTGSPNALRVYKVRQTSPVSESRDIVGAMKVTYSTSPAPGTRSSLVSTPLVPYNATLDVLLGGQFAKNIPQGQATKLETWNSTTNRWTGTVYHTGGGPVFWTPSPPSFTWSANRAYLLTLGIADVPVAGGSKAVVYVGKVSPTRRDVLIPSTGAVAPFPPVALGTCFPKTVSLKDSGLQNHLVGGSPPAQRDQVWFYNQATNRYLTYTWDGVGSWVPAPAPNLVPGGGFMLKRVKTNLPSDVWKYWKPYLVPPN